MSDVGQRFINNLGNLKTLVRYAEIYDYTGIYVRSRGAFNNPPSQIPRLVSIILQDYAPTAATTDWTDAQLGRLEEYLFSEVDRLRRYIAANSDVAPRNMKEIHRQNIKDIDRIVTLIFQGFSQD